MYKHQGYSKLSLRRNQLLKRWGGCGVTESQKIYLSLKMPSHRINIPTLTETLSGFSDLLECLRRETTDSKGIEIKVEALEPGSFEICLNLINVVRSSPLLETAGAIVILTELTRLLTAYLQCKAALGNKKADSVVTVGDHCIVNGKQYVAQQVFNIYRTNTEAAGACNRFTKGIRSDKSITGFELHGQNKEELLNFDADQLEQLSTPNAYMDEELRVAREKTILKVSAPSLDCRSQWKCLYHGEKVNVTFMDKYFLKEVKSGRIRFANNDPLYVDMEIEMRKVPETGLWENRNYTVLSVDLEKLNELPQQITFV